MSSPDTLPGIYRINLSPTHFYVGRSSDIKRRVRVHHRKLKHGDHENDYMQRVYNHHRHFEWVILKSCGNTEESVEVEQSLLDLLIGTEGCVNLNRSAISGPGMSGKKHTDETRKRIREARSHQVFSDDTRCKFSQISMGNTRAKGHRHCVSEDTRQKISESRVGMVFSEAHRQALSKAKKGRTMSDLARQKLSQSQKAYWELVRQGQIVRGV